MIEKSVTNLKEKIHDWRDRFTKNFEKCEIDSLIEEGCGLLDKGVEFKGILKTDIKYVGLAVAYVERSFEGVNCTKLKEKIELYKEPN